MADLNTCPRCNELSDTVEKRRLCTRFQDDESNFLESCEECYEEVEDMYQEQWHELYSDIYRDLNSSW